MPLSDPDPVQPRADDGLDALFDGRDLTRDQARALFARIVEGELPEHLMAAAFVCLKLKGETAEEDRAEAQHLVKLYSPDKERLGAFHHKVERGMVEVIFREAELQRLAPAQFK